jgi:hypothetical protein
MEVLDLNYFMSFKLNDNLQNLDNNILDQLNSLFGGDKFKKNKKHVKKQNILKNRGMQNKKENIGNRITLILNKLSETNVDNLIIEFLENINQIDSEQFEEVQKAFYNKIISEINFIKIYIHFLKIISYLYKTVQKHNLQYFFSTIETKFKLDYTDFEILPDSPFEFLKELSGEQKRINNLILIRSMVENNLMSNKVIYEIDNIILKQSVFLPDIYYWFNSSNRNLTDNEKNTIEQLINKPNIAQRDKILLDNLLNIKNLSTPEKITVKEKETNKILQGDTFKLECENIIEEYLMVKSVDDIIYFITTKKMDAIMKNKFCKCILDKYFMLNKEQSNEILELSKVLIKNQTIFKSNLSRGLALLYSEWKELSIDYNKPNDKMKNLLNTLKTLSITKGIENIFEHFKVKLT